MRGFSLLGAANILDAFVIPFFVLKPPALFSPSKKGPPSERIGWREHGRP